MKFCIKIIIIFFLVSISVNEINAQILPTFGDSRTGTTGFQFLKIAPDAYSVGLSEAVIADELGANGMYWNPASIITGDTQTFQFNVNSLLYYADIKMQSFAGIYKLDDDKRVGLSLTYLNTGDMAVTTEFQPFGTGQDFNAVNFSLSAAYAQKLTDYFNYGVNLKLVHEGIADIRSNTFLFDFGFQYFIDIAKTRFAVSLSNFGFNANPKGEIPVLDLNGLSTVDEFQKINVPAIFRIGMTYEALNNNKNMVNVSAQLNHPTDNNETFNIGAEYNYNQFLFVRTGYQFGQDETTFPSFGFGLDLQRNFGIIGLDYAYSSRKLLGAKNIVSANFSF